MKLEIDAVTLWLIPVGIALWFMIWVLWNWRREERRKHFRAAAHGTESKIAQRCEVAISPSEAYWRSSQPPVPFHGKQRFQRQADLMTR